MTLYEGIATKGMSSYDMQLELETPVMLGIHILV
jgi:hypothetical protein